MIGKTLQAVIDENKTNVNELAKKINVSPQTLYSIIKRDNMKVDIEVLLKICIELGVDIERFYGDYCNAYSKTHSDKLNIDKLSAEYLEMFNQLHDVDKGRILNEMKNMLQSSDYITFSEAQNS